MTTMFRAALRNELSVWLRGGVISEETAAQLSSQYQLDSLKDESSRLLSSVIFTVGALLLGGGLISFVAANWERISDPIRLAVLFSTLISLHAAGYWLWHARGWRRLGHGLIFSGCLVFGANIGLVAQIFQVRGEWYGLFGAWALGSLAMAWAIRSWAIGGLVLGTSFIWFLGFGSDHERLALLYPAGLALALAPLAWTVGSRVLYAGTLMGIVTAACVLAGLHGRGDQVLLAMTAGGLFLWTLGEVQDGVWPRRDFSRTARGLGFILLPITAYVWSFHPLWSSTHRDRSPSVWAIILLALTGVASTILLRRKEQARRFALLGILAVGVLLSGSALVSMYTVDDREMLFVTAANIAAVILAGVAIRISLIEEQRLLFWGGSLYIVLLILSRFLEYETSLMLKSVAFLACGAAVIFAGIKYERYVRRNRPEGRNSAGEVGRE